MESVDLYMCSRVLRYNFDFTNTTSAGTLLWAALLASCLWGTLPPASCELVPLVVWGGGVNEIEIPYAVTLPSKRGGGGGGGLTASEYGIPAIYAAQKLLKMLIFDLYKWILSVCSSCYRVSGALSHFIKIMQIFSVRCIHVYNCKLDASINEFLQPFVAS